MEYRVTRTLPHPPDRIWQVLKDVDHFARDDPFHHDFAYIGERRSGVGTSFTLRHTYWPIFPFAADRITCTITQSEPERIQTLLERNDKSYRTHVQRFVLSAKGTGTIVEYTITYGGIPAWMFPFSHWVRWLVTRRMRAKLGQLARSCGAEDRHQGTPLNVAA